QLFEVELNKSLSLEDLKNLQEGIRIKEGFIKPLAVAFVENKSHRHIGIEIQSSIPQVVHKLFNKLDYEVVGLDRVVYGNLTKKDLPRGKYRHLKHQEIINLGML